MSFSHIQYPDSITAMASPANDGRTIELYMVVAEHQGSDSNNFAFTLTEQQSIDFVAHLNRLGFGAKA